MPLNNEERTAQEVVLRLLETQRQDSYQQISYHQSRVKDLNTTIAMVAQGLDSDANPSKPQTTSRTQSEKYANMSVRWAILDLLSEAPPMTTAEIAESLKAGGIETRATDFANNVSAVLSTSMKGNHGEVKQLSDGKWELTESGKSAIDHIRNLAKFRSATRGRYSARF